MCGLTGFWAAAHQNEAALQATAKGMADAITHRGPGIRTPKLFWWGFREACDGGFSDIQLGDGF